MQNPGSQQSPGRVVLGLSRAGASVLTRGNHEPSKSLHLLSSPKLGKCAQIRLLRAYSVCFG